LAIRPTEHVKGSLTDHSRWVTPPANTWPRTNQPIEPFATVADPAHPRKCPSVFVRRRNKNKRSGVIKTICLNDSRPLIDFLHIFNTLVPQDHYLRRVLAVVDFERCREEKARILRKPCRVRGRFVDYNNRRARKNLLCPHVDMWWATSGCGKKADS